MKSLEPCPACCAHVDIVSVKHTAREHKKNRYMVNCHHCGFGTAKAYPSITTLKALWNALVGHTH